MRRVPRSNRGTSNCKLPRHTGGASSRAQHRYAVLAFHLNELQLDPIRSLEETYSPATSYRGLLQNIDTTGLQFVHQRIQLISINGNVLHTVMLCTFLAVDE